MLKKDKRCWLERKCKNLKISSSSLHRKLFGPTSKCNFLFRTFFAVKTLHTNEIVPSYKNFNQAYFFENAFRNWYSTLNPSGNMIPNPQSIWGIFQFVTQLHQADRLLCCNFICQNTQLASANVISCTTSRWRFARSFVNLQSKSSVSTWL